jgi:hypothetical protein
MKVYGYEYSEKRQPCEQCGFPAFDDELVCHNCSVTIRQ